MPTAEDEAKRWTNGRSLRTKAEAKAFQGDTVARQAVGTWISPDAGKVALHRWAAG